MIKKWMTGVMMVAVAGAAWAEPESTLLTRENKLPEKGQVEIGALIGMQALEFEKHYQETPYLRYGLLGNLAANVTIPVKQIRVDQGFNGNRSGLGDVTVGLELVPYQDAFRFPYIMPHVDVGFPTGDQDKNLGSGDVSVFAGVTVGTTTYEVYHWAVDVSVRHLVDNDPMTKDDTVVLAGSFIWDLSEEFSLLTEIGGSNQDLPDGRPITFEGGMVYKPADTAWLLGLYGGKTIHSSEDWNGTIKVSYSF